MADKQKCRCFQLRNVSVKTKDERLQATKREFWLEVELHGNSTLSTNKHIQGGLSWNLHRHFAIVRSDSSMSIRVLQGVEEKFVVCSATFSASDLRKGEIGGLHDVMKARTLSFLQIPPFVSSVTMQGVLCEEHSSVRGQTKPPSSTPEQEATGKAIKGLPLDADAGEGRGDDGLEDSPLTLSSLIQLASASQLREDERAKRTMQLKNVPLDVRKNDLYASCPDITDIEFFPKGSKHKSALVEFASPSGVNRAFMDAIQVLCGASVQLKPSRLSIQQVLRQQLKAETSRSREKDEKIWELTRQLVAANERLVLYMKAAHSAGLQLGPSGTFLGRGSHGKEETSERVPQVQLAPPAAVPRQEPEPEPEPQAKLPKTSEERLVALAVEAIETLYARMREGRKRREAAFLKALGIAQDWYEEGRRLMMEQENERLLQELLAQERQERDVQLQSKTYPCPICFMDNTIEELYVLDGCYHKFCTTCLEGYLRVKITDGQVKKIDCPDPDCSVPIHVAEVKHLTSSEDFEKYEKFCLQKALDAMPDLVWCPRAGCTNAMIGDRHNPFMRCSDEANCNFTFCFNCKVEWHADATCDEYLQWKKDNEAGDTEYEKWVAKNAKPCPACKVNIEKSGGCNHMSCQNCNHQFCWLCMATYTSKHFRETDCRQFS